MELTPEDIYEKIAKKEMSVDEGMELIQSIENKQQQKQQEKLKSTTKVEASKALIIDELKTIISEIIDKPTAKIDVEIGFYEQGLESNDLLKVVQVLEKKFNEELYPTLLFEYTNITSLSEFIEEKYGDKYTQKTPTTLIRKKQTTSSINIESNKSILTQKEIETPVTSKQDEQDIAIIGLSGRYPMADNVYQFWENLKAGKDCIIEIPDERWDYKKFYNSDKNHKGTTYSKWGSFISDVDKFDPLFFNISPREAEIMDPQERLFLQEAWKTLEDAGYTKKTLGTNQIGVFAGVMYGDYQLFHPNSTFKEQPNAFYASIANRVSYFFNFNGPSISLDTMCSSSLTTIHLACQSIKNKECELAIAGGVNVTIHPNKYLRLAQQNFLSTDGRCRAFGKDGDGYVPGEGVGAVLLKPLKKAEEDNDHIYAVIKSSSVNHGGKASGSTVPNPNAQASLIVKAIEDSKIDPRTISYIEAHGTGTSLGDPIEITGLTKAYKKFTKDTQFCPIGSVKSNIGHLESAAGISGLTKLLLQFKYKQLVPSIHSDPLNPNINFKESPFYVQNKLEEWKRPIINKLEYPRRAGISGFGAGGSNSHIILEEYNKQAPLLSQDKTETQLVIFSARTKESLDSYIKELLTFLINLKTSNSLPSLSDIAYTLQFCREHMAHRLAITTNSVEELISTLEKYVAPKDKLPENLEIGNIQSKRRKSDYFIEGEEGDKFVRMIADNRNFSKLAQMWVHGVDIDWSYLNKNNSYNKVSLPTYSFSKKRFWVSKNLLHNSTTEAGQAKLHPLVGMNTSTFYEQQYKTVFSGEEFYIKDHVVDKDKLFPGVGYLEMARAAGFLAANNEVTSIKNITWLRPLSISEKPLEAYITFLPTDSDTKYEIWSLNDKGMKIVNSNGDISFEQPEHKNEALELEPIMKRCSQNRSNSECYSLFKEKKLNYGPGFQGIKKLSYNDNEALAELEVPPNLQSSLKGVQLHPTIMDGSLQAVVGLRIDDKKNSTFLPFSLDKIEIIHPTEPKCFAYIKAIDEDRTSFNIIITDIKGKVLVKINGFTVREYAPQKKLNKVKTKINSKTNIIKELLIDLKAGRITANEADKILGGDNEL